LFRNSNSVVEPGYTYQDRLSFYDTDRITSGLILVTTAIYYLWPISDLATSLLQIPDLSNL